MKIPNYFKTELSKRGRQEEKKRLNQAKEEKEYQERLDEYKEYEKSKLKFKIEICKKIFAWKNEFLRTKEGTRIFKKENKHLLVYGGKWAHGVPRFSGDGCWSRIYFNKNNIEYRSGYKCGSYPSLHFTKPEEMAKKLDYDYLKKFSDDIQSKIIFRFILELSDS